MNTGGGIFVFLAWLLLSINANAQTVTVYTDKPDYLPGDTVLIGGTGWLPGEMVKLEIDHSTVSQGNTVLYAQANSSGIIFNNQFIIQNIHLGESFTLLATGLSSGYIAQTTFTDGNAPGSVTVGAQTGTAVYGQISTVSYEITITRASGQNGSNTAFYADLAVSIPQGAQDQLIGYTFSSNPAHFPGSSTSNVKVTLTLIVPALPNFLNYPFSVSATTGTVTKTGNGQLTIQPKQLTPQLIVADKIYDGNTSATIATKVLDPSEILNNHNVTLSGGTATFTSETAGTNKPVNITGLSLSGAQAGFYAIQLPPVTANITPKPLTVTNVTIESKIYDGTTAATATSGTLSGIVGNDKVTLVTGTAVFDTKTVGSGKKVTCSNFSLTGKDAGNYTVANLSFESTAGITQKSLTLYGITADNKIYDGTNVATLSGTPVLFGLIGSDQASVDMSNVTANFPNKNVGSNKLVNVTGISLTGPDAINYSIGSLPTFRAAITHLGITGYITINNKVYDRTTDAVIDSRTLSGVIPGDVVSYTGGTATFADPWVGVGKTVTASSLSLTGTDAGNYTVNTTATATADITQKSVTASFTAADKVYDGTATATITPQLNDLISGDIVNLIWTSATFDSPASGTNKVVSLTGAALAGSGAPNYELTSVGTATAAITPRGIIISPDAGQSKVYGNADPVFSYTSGEPLISGNSFTGALGRTSGETVAGGPYDYNLGNLSAGGNYTLTLNAYPAFAITPRPITITADAKSKLYGDGDPDLTAQATNVVIGDVATGTLSRAPGENVGIYPISKNSYTYGSNYQETYVGAYLTIGQATLTVTANAKTVQYSDAVTFDAAITGFKNAEGSSIISGLPAFTTNASIVNGQVLSKAGNYTITPCLGSLNTANYQFSFVPGILTVIREDASVVYSGLEYFITQNTNGDANVEFIANLEDDNDGANTRGNISNAKVDFWTDANLAISNGSITDKTVGLVDPANTTVGSARTGIFTVRLGNSDITNGGTTFGINAEVNVITVDQYYNGSTNGPMLQSLSASAVKPEKTLVTIAVPGKDYVNGGGHMVVTNSFGSYAATVNSKVNFGFTMKWNKTGKNIQGQTTIVFRRLENGIWKTYKIKSNAINTLGTANVTGGRRADFNTKATLTDITNELSPVTISGNLDLSVQALESTDPAFANEICMTLRSGNQVIFCSHWVNNSPTRKGLGKGSIKVLNSGQVAARTADVSDNAVADLFKIQPNPFNNATAIRFALKNEQQYALEVYDIRGALVKKLNSGNAKAGQVYEFDLEGGAMGKGIYIVKLVTQSGVQTLRLLKE